MARIAVVDLSSIFRRWWHALQEAEFDESRRRTIAACVEYARGFDHVAICVDRPPYKRREILPEYKANREASSAQMIDTVRSIADELDAEGWHVLGAQGYEADDIIATITTWAVDAGHEVTIYSSDKDLMQLCTSMAVVQISIATGEKYDAEGVLGKFGVGPHLVGDLLALVGDASDNVPGLKGVGVKTAAKWLTEIGPLETILADVDRVPERFRELVASSRDQIRTARRVIELDRAAPIECAAILTTKERREPEEVLDMEPEIIDAPDAQQDDKPKALAIVQPQSPIEWERSLEPRDPTQAWKLAQMVFKSRVFGEFPNPEAILSVVMTGRSLGMDAIASLRGFHVIKGKVSPSSQLLVGLVKRHPSCEWFRFVEGDDKHAVWETKRADEPEPTRLAYTIEQATRAGLVGNDNWRKRPETMLRWRASTELARLVYPDVTAGLYTKEELEDMRDAA